jgi:hypothetical protein
VTAMSDDEGEGRCLPEHTRPIEQPADAGPVGRSMLAAAMMGGCR